MGCAGKQHYPNAGEKNLTVNTQLEHARFSVRTGLVSKMEAYLGIHEIDYNCAAKYLGFVPLTQGSTEVALPIDRLMLLSIEVSISSLGGSSTTMQREALFKAKPSHTYQLNASYVNGMFDLQLREAGDLTSSRTLELMPLSACRNSM